MDATIRTYSGLLIDLLNPDPKLIMLGDIAHSLSLINRFGGHTPQPYSVAEHSILVASSYDDPKDYRTALLHDASEAYLGDMVGPLKHSGEMRAFILIELSWEKALAERFDLYPPSDEFVSEVKERDKELFEWERTFIRNNPCRVAPNAADVKFQFATRASTRGEIRG